MDGVDAGVVVPVRFPVVSLDSEKVEEDLMNDGARDFRFEESGDLDFLDEEDWPGTASISGGMGSGDAVRFLRDGCPGLGEG